MPLDNTTHEQQESKPYRGEWLSPVGGFLLVTALGTALWGAAIWFVFRFLS